MFVRYLDKKTNETRYGNLITNHSIQPIDGDIFTEYTLAERIVTKDEYTLLPPVTPSKVVAVGLNYKDHAEEVGLALPEHPMLFIKPSTAVVGDGDKIVYPDATERLEFEAELGIVIKKEAKDVKEEEAADYILGYTNANDVTARDIQFSDKILTHLTWSKSYDTFAPIGPGIVDLTLNEVSQLDVSLYLNGERKQHSNTRELIFSVPYLISFISKIMTLNPGDVIITGTPHGIAEMQKGDEVVVEIERLGTLTNHVQ